MRVDVWDSGFVRAERAAIHPLLAHLDGYGRWWPGCRTQPLGAATRVVLDPPGLLARRQRYVVAVTKERPDLGLDLQLTGDLQGAGEWYYLDERDGTVVHYVLHVEIADRAWRRTLAAHRASARAALHALKDRMEGDRLPGTEPDPTLLARQSAASAAFRARAEAHAARVAALDARPQGTDPAGGPAS